MIPTGTLQSECLKSCYAPAMVTGGRASSDHDAYVDEIRNGAPWDVVVVDGMARNSALLSAIENVVANGLIVLDDSDLDELRPSLEALAAAGFC